MKNNKLKVLVIILSVLLLAAAVTIAILFLGNKKPEESETASETESGSENQKVTEDFDYLGADLSKYITLSPELYKNTTVTLSTEYLVDDALVQKYIDDECFKNRQKLHAGSSLRDRAIAYGDSAFIYYTGYINGEIFEGGSNADDESPYELVVGSGAFFPGVEDALIGVIPESTGKDNPFIVNVNFPENYEDSSLAGKAVAFHIWVEYTIQYVIPEFNSEFVKDVLKFEGTADEYKANVKAELGDDALVQQYIERKCFENRKPAGQGEIFTHRPINHGDSAYIYYTGYLDGVAFEGGSNADDKYSYELVIGSGSFIPGFEDALIGLIPSQTSKENPHKINLTFPEDYSHVDLAGKDVVFHVWVEYTIQYSIPEFNDTYVHETLKFSGSTEEYREDVRTKLETASKDAAEEEAVSAIMSQLIEKATVIEYPEQSVEYWYYQYLDQFEYYMQYYSYYYGYTFNNLDEFVSLYMGLEEGADPGAAVVSLAKEVVRNNLIYYTIAKQEGLSISDEEYKEGLAALVIYYNDYYASSGSTVTYTEESLVAELGEKQIRQNMLFDKVDDCLLENCTIEYKDAE